MTRLAKSVFKLAEQSGHCKWEGEFSFARKRSCLEEKRMKLHKFKQKPTDINILRRLYLMECKKKVIYCGILELNQFIKAYLNCQILQCQRNCVKKTKLTEFIYDNAWPHCYAYEYTYVFLRLKNVEPVSCYWLFCPLFLDAFLFTFLSG